MSVSLRLIKKKTRKVSRFNRHGLNKRTLGIFGSSEPRGFLFSVFVFRIYQDIPDIRIRLWPHKDCHSRMAKSNTLWWTNILPWKITIFNGKIHYKWPFSIAMLVHQRVRFRRFRRFRFHSLGLQPLLNPNLDPNPRIPASLGHWITYGRQWWYSFKKYHMALSENRIRTLKIPIYHHCFRIEYRILIFWIHLGYIKGKHAVPWSFHNGNPYGGYNEPYRRRDDHL